MMDKELFRKMTDEHSLTAEEALRVDEALEGTQSLARVVSCLEDDQPSLSWRSVLNQRLAHVSRRRRTATVLRFGFAGTALACASVLAIMVFQPMNEPASAPERYVENEPTLEDTILSEHEEAMQNASLGIYVAYDESGS